MKEPAGQGDNPGNAEMQSELLAPARGEGSLAAGCPRADSKTLRVLLGWGATNVATLAPDCGGWVLDRI